MKRLAIFAACLALFVALVLTSCQTPPQTIAPPVGKGEVLTAPSPTIWQRVGSWFTGASYTQEFKGGWSVKVAHKEGGAEVTVTVPLGEKPKPQLPVDLTNVEVLPLEK